MWHWKTGAGMHCVQRMMHSTTLKDEHGRETVIPLVITPHYKSTPNCPVPKCMACQLARAKCQNTGVSTSKPVPEKKDILAWDRYKVGDYVSADQFIVPITGRLPLGYGC